MTSVSVPWARAIGGPDAGLAHRETKTLDYLFTRFYPRVLDIQGANVDRGATWAARAPTESHGWHVVERGRTGKEWAAAGVTAGVTRHK